jgi:tyrosyl-tRNA synthetase
LITKADGSKFGKSEGGNVWLAPDKTSPYKFYQYWLNVSDEDAAKFTRMFSLKPLEEIDGICKSHAKAPHERQLQKALSAEMTARLHSDSDLKNAIKASSILFSESTRSELLELSDLQIEEVFADVPRFDLSRAELEAGFSITDLLSIKTGIMPSKGEARRMLQSNGISINKEKAEESKMVGISDLIRNRFLIVQKGKKNYYLIRAV